MFENNELPNITIRKISVKCGLLGNMIVWDKFVIYVKLLFTLMDTYDRNSIMTETRSMT